MHSLYDEWLTDQAVAFAAAWLCYDNTGKYGEELFVAAGRCIAESVDIIGNVSLPTLSLLAAIEEYDDQFDGEGFDISETLCRAREVLSMLTEKNAPSVALAANAAVIIQREQLSFGSFLKWAKRVSPRIKLNDPRTIGWNRAIWLRMHDRFQEESISDIDAALSNIRDPSERMGVRLSALDRMFRLVNEGADIDPQRGIAQSWFRFAKDMVSRQFCWPLMVAQSTRGYISGISLPICAFLTYDGKSKVWFKDGTRRFKSFYDKAQNSKSFGFEDGRLRWDADWHDAFQTGLRTAKDLWVAQNGRLADSNEKEKRRTCSLVVDLSHANAIVSRLYDQADSSECYSLAGRSAEAYFTQVVLGLMLPEESKPDGAATGAIQYEEGFHRLSPVNGIREKLRYANSTGMFSRIILPEDERIKAEAGEEVKELGQARLVEINYSPSARSAADAMQLSGWRRTHFFRAPAVQRSFYHLLYELAQYENMQQSSNQPIEYPDDYLPEDDRNEIAVEAIHHNPLSENDIRKLQQLSAYLTSDVSAIKYCKRSDVNLNEELLGKWLAWVDHQVRSGRCGEPGPGLGVLCVRTSDRDNEIRFWSAVFDILNVNPRLWERFHWADVRTAADILASVLNNSKGDQSISYSPAPDLLIVIDDAGYTQNPTNRVFPEDFRGQLYDLLNPRKSRQPHYLPDALVPLHISREALLGKTRVVVIYDQTGCEEELDAESISVDDGLKRLAIFRESFSVQSAVAMLHYDDELMGNKQHVYECWGSVREKLNQWVINQQLFRHRGQYHMNRKLKRGLQSLPEHQDPGLHFAAARSLAPIIEPDRLFLAANRDSVMEPEQLAEAMWHLQEASKYCEQKNTTLRQTIRDAIATLTFLRPDPDWDTVKQLISTNRADEGYFLSKELIESESQQGRTPHSSRYALAIHTIGRYARMLSAKPDKKRDVLSEATKLYQMAQNQVAASSVSVLQQQIKLDSEYAYCLRNNLSIVDGMELEDLEAILESKLDALLKQRGLIGVETPVSRGWLTLKWNDRTCSNAERARFARYACELCENSWDLPWLVQLALMGDDFETPQVAKVLNNWKLAYGTDTEDFFQRVSGMNRKMLGEFPASVSMNLLGFLVRPDDRLQGTTALYAQSWITALRTVITPYTYVRGQDKRFRNQSIWDLCLLIGMKTPRAWAKLGSMQTEAELLLESIGVKNAWLFVLASQKADEQTMHALPTLLSCISINEIPRLATDENLRSFVQYATRNIDWWLKITWTKQEYEQIAAVKVALSHR